MRFEIVSPITSIETIATGRGIRDLARIRRTFGTPLRKGSAYEDELTRIPPGEAGGWFTPDLPTEAGLINPTSGSWWIVHTQPFRNGAFGKGRWRKLKGIAKVKLLDGSIHSAEIHWYEAHGIGKRDFKIKPPLID